MLSGFVAVDSNSSDNVPNEIAHVDLAVFFLFLLKSINMFLSLNSVFFTHVWKGLPKVCGYQKITPNGYN